MKSPGAKHHKSPARLLLLALVASLFIGLLAASPRAHADWHYGKIVDIYFAYDGSNVTLAVENLTKTACTCYTPWPNRMCLDRSHLSYKEQLSAVYLAKAAGSRVVVNIDELTCKVIALGIE